MTGKAYSRYKETSPRCLGSDRAPITRGRRRSALSPRPANGVRTRANTCLFSEATRRVTMGARGGLIPCPRWLKKTPYITQNERIATAMRSFFFEPRARRFDFYTALWTAFAYYLIFHRDAADAHIKPLSAKRRRALLTPPGDVPGKPGPRGVRHDGGPQLVLSPAQAPPPRPAPAGRGLSSSAMT
jgi:hypothetical protein